MIAEATIALLVTGSPFPGTGQVDSLVSAGERLRITSRENTRIVIVERVTDSHLTYRAVDGDGSRSLSWADISLVEREIPNSRVTGMTRGMGSGFGLGFIAGFIFGVIVGEADDDGGQGDGTELSSLDFNPIVLGFAGGVGLGVVGMLVGGSIGAARPGSSWERVEPNMHASMTISRDNTLSVCVSVPF